MDFNSTIPLVIAAAFLAEVIMYLSSSSVHWLEHNLSSLLLRTLVVGRRQQSESIEVALDNME